MDKTMYQVHALMRTRPLTSRLDYVPRRPRAVLMKQLTLIVTILLCDIACKCGGASDYWQPTRSIVPCIFETTTNGVGLLSSTLLRGVFEGHLQGAIAYGLLHNITQFSDLPFVWCPSDKSTVSDVQLVNVYTKYVEQRPEVADRSAANIAATAFMIAWPCQK